MILPIHSPVSYAYVVKVLSAGHTQRECNHYAAVFSWVHDVPAQPGFSKNKIYYLLTKHTTVSLQPEGCKLQVSGITDWKLTF